MEKTRYAYRTTIDASYEDAIEKTTAALQAEGFGVLTEIDVKATFKKKLDVDFRKYIILGACNPAIAHQALTAEIEVGLLLPCNVIVYETDDGKTAVSAIDPVAQLGVAGASHLNEAAETVAHKLKRVIESLEKES